MAKTIKQTNESSIVISLLANDHILKESSSPIKKDGEGFIQGGPKTEHPAFVFAKCRSIFKIISLAHAVRNLQ